MDSHDIIVVGSGVAGLGAAFELQKNGKRVLVLEKENYIGGRMATKHIENIPLDLGAQFITPFYKNIWSLIKELDLNPVKITSGNLAIQKRGILYSFNSENPISLLSYRGLSYISRLKLFITFLKKSIQARQIDLYDLKSYLKFDNKSVYKDMIPKVTQESFDYFLNPMCEALFHYDSCEFSNAMFLAVLSKITFIKLYSFNKGIDLICRMIANRLNVQLKTKVKKIKRFKNEVVIETDKRTLKSQQVIIAIPGNNVFNLLNNPTNVEKEFFTQVKYSSGGYIFCSGKTNLFKNYSTIWLPQKENAFFSAVGSNPYTSRLTNDSYFYIEVRKNGDDLMREQGRQKLKSLIRESFKINNLEILHTHFWKSALPKFVPGHLRKIYQFLEKTKKEKQIFYCGDYLENPSTEGALTSGINLAKRLLQ